MTTEEQLMKKDMVVDYLRRLPIYKWAAAWAGINQDTLKDWRKADQAFSDRCESARSEAIEKLGKRATPDFILKSVDPSTFKERVDVTSGDKPIPIVDVVLPNLSVQKDKQTD